eukprot:scaffold36556_cov62-Phaeocystis_antarctica.AAC.6
MPADAPQDDVGQLPVRLVWQREVASIGRLLEVSDVAVVGASLDAVHERQRGHRVRSQIAKPNAAVASRHFTA